MSARTGQPGRAYELLRIYADVATTENSLHVNTDPRRKGIMSMGGGIPTPEGGLAAAAALLEMLVQSWHGVIRVFPATPEWWPDASFERLRAEGAFLLSARRKEAKTVWVRIESEAGLPCRVRNRRSPSKAPPASKTNDRATKSNSPERSWSFPRKKDAATPSRRGMLVPLDRSRRPDPVPSRPSAHELVRAEEAREILMIPQQVQTAEARQVSDLPRRHQVTVHQYFMVGIGAFSSLKGWHRTAYCRGNAPGDRGPTSRKP